MISQTRISRIVITALVALFLVVIACGISKRTQSAVAPPIYDPVTYYYKSAYVWDCLSKGNFLETMSGPFNIRPPGTALILYPLGFKPSVKSFLFRSVFAPVVIWALGLMIFILPSVFRTSDALLGGSLIAGLLSMPMFYHFQAVDAGPKFNFDISAQWGLVDPLEAAVSAMAVGFIFVGIKRTSKTLSTIGWFAGILSFYIKPSGILVMAALFAIASVELILRYYRESAMRHAILKFGALIFLIGLFVFGVALRLAFHTEYLSSGTIAAGIKASRILISFNRGQALGPLLSAFIHPVIGWWFFCPMTFFAVLFTFETITLLQKHELSATGLRLAASVLIASAAIWWWLCLAGTEHRYLFPFLLMLIAWFIPDAFARLGQLAVPSKASVVVYCLIPYCLLAEMLNSANTDIRLQTMMGVNLTADQYADEAKLGEWLVDQSKKLKRPLHIYSMTDSCALAEVEMSDTVFQAEHLSSPTHIIISRPLSWVDSSGLHVSQILQSDFLLMGDVSPVNSQDEVELISNWQEEVARFKRFVYFGRGANKNGLELVSDGHVKLLRIVDERKFGDAICKWAQSIQWKNDFNERNKPFLESHMQPSLPE